MQPIVIDGWCTLYHADNAEIVDVLRGYEPNAVITDPPYGINYKPITGGAVEVKYPGNATKASIVHRPEVSEGIYGDNTQTDIALWASVAPQLIVWGADHLRSRLPEGGRFLVWDKLGYYDLSNTFSDAEIAWHSEGKAVRKITHLWKGLTADRRGEERHGACNAKRDHPMQKPVRVMEWCIEQCRLERGATILDPYMGSGTTAIAAFKRGMQFVGVEIDRRWFDVAVERIKRQTENGPLFEAQRQPEQVALIG